MKGFKPADAGDRCPRFATRTAAAHFMGWRVNVFPSPGAHAPGFTLTPASQAKTKRRRQSRG
ncbi:MAG TPA: hypothetical protein VFR78_23440 [Pyrinomonadaceae bacterium]|nr:hypothetical protein [Pyrinomonadaceae bacterium]